MSFDIVRKMIEEKLLTLTFPVPVQWENSRQRPPAGPWMRCTILQAETVPMIIGPGLTRRTGSVNLSVFLPEDLGTRLALQAADVAATGLDAKHITEGGVMVTFGHVSCNPSGARSGYLQQTIWCNFHADIQT